MQNIADLMQTIPQVGIVTWLGARPEKGVPMQSVDSVKLEAGRGIVGDRYSKVGGNRQVTLIQAEHIDAIGSMLGQATLNPATLRRNIVVKGVNLLALKDKHFKIGDIVFQYTGLCHPCSKMETALGPGGYNAMRGHGGINAKVHSSGLIHVTSEVTAITNKASAVEVSE